MKLTTCPTCHRSSTWSAKWQTCSACDQFTYLNEVRNDSFPFVVTKLDPRDVSFVTHGGELVEVEVRAIGRPRKYESAAARQRAYRERKGKT